MSEQLIGSTKAKFLAKIEDPNEAFIALNRISYRALKCVTPARYEYVVKLASSDCKAKLPRGISKLLKTNKAPKSLGFAMQFASCDLSSLKKV